MKQHKFIYCLHVLGVGQKRSCFLTPHDLVHDRGGPVAVSGWDSTCFMSLCWTASSGPGTSIYRYGQHMRSSLSQLVKTKFWRNFACFTFCWAQGCRSVFIIYGSGSSIVKSYESGSGSWCSCFHGYFFVIEVQFLCNGWEHYVPYRCL